MIPSEEQDIRIARFLSGEASPEEAMAMADWISEDPLHAQYLEEAKWILCQGTKSETKVAWQRLRAEMKRSPVKWYTWFVAAAAVVIIGLCFGWWLNYPLTNAIKPVVYTANHVRTIALPDGSSARLMAASHLTVTGKRHFSFSGSGEFSIMHQAADPVVIDMGRFFIKDLGTRFSIRSSFDQDTISIEVHQGKVLLFDVHQASLVVKAGEKARYIRSAHHLEHDTAIRKSVIKPRIKKNKIHRAGTFEKDSNIIIHPVAPIPPVRKIIKPVKADTNTTKPIQ